MAKRNNKEENLQVACVQYFRLKHKKFCRQLIHIQNSLPFMGNNRNAFFNKLGRLKAMGLEKGIPDLFLAVRRSIYSGMFIELKAKGEKPFKEQEEMIQILSDAGFLCHVIDNIDDFIKIVDNYLNSPYVAVHKAA